MYHIGIETELTAEMIIGFIEDFKLNHLPRFRKLENYYLNKTAIKDRVFSDISKPNNKISHSWANYITDTMTAFFLGEPVSYQGEDVEVLDRLKYIFNENDEQDLNIQLSRDCSKYGVAYELTYLDGGDKKEIKLVKLNVLNTIPIYDDSVNAKLLYVIRFNEIKDIVKNEVNTTIEVYTSEHISTYSLENKTLVPIDTEVPHEFGIVPISVYKNNDDLLGDYEGVMDLIDLYDRLESDTANAFDYYNDAYLVFEGATIPENVAEMKENRILETPEGSKVYFLLKNAVDTEQENVKNRVVNDIHKFSKVPNMSDEQFANNVSGVAMKYKLLGLENSCSIKERKFKKGLQNRLWLISNMLNILEGYNNQTSLQDVKINFKRNIPNNEVEVADYINKLRGLVSTETLISQLSFVEDVTEEMEKLEAENDFNTYGDEVYLNDENEGADFTREDN